MNEVKRYSIGVDGIDPNGNLVTYKDYSALKAERDALAALAEERRQFIVNGVEMGDILLPVIDGDPAIGIHERCLIKPEFAYDAYHNSVRAEGVEMFALYLAETAIKEGADYTWWKSTASNEACDYAAQLRAGKDGE